MTSGKAMKDVAKAMTESHEIVGRENYNIHLVEAEKKSSEHAPDDGMLRAEGGVVWLTSHIATGEKACLWWHQGAAGTSARRRWPLGQLKTDAG